MRPRVGFRVFEFTLTDRSIVVVGQLVGRPDRADTIHEPGAHPRRPSATNEPNIELAEIFAIDLHLRICVGTAKSIEYARA